MHAEAYAGFGRMLALAKVDTRQALSVLDIGGQDVNGTVHDYFFEAEVTTLDLENADIVADATTWVPDRQFDLVIATEVFEHVQHWQKVLRTMYLALKPGGALVATCASTDRPAHGATGAPAPAPGEWYGNVNPKDLELVLGALFREYEVYYNYPPGDAYMWARKS